MQGCDHDVSQIQCTCPLCTSLQVWTSLPHLPNLCKSKWYYFGLQYRGGGTWGRGQPCKSGRATGQSKINDAEGIMGVLGEKDSPILGIIWLKYNPNCLYISCICILGILKSILQIRTYISCQFGFYYITSPSLCNNIDLCYTIIYCIYKQVCLYLWYNTEWDRRYPYVAPFCIKKWVFSLEHTSTIYT